MTYGPSPDKCSREGSPKRSKRKAWIPSLGGRGDWELGDMASEKRKQDSTTEKGILGFQRAIDQLSGGYKNSQELYIHGKVEQLERAQSERYCVEYI